MEKATYRTSSVTVFLTSIYLCECYSCTALPKHLFKAREVVEGYANKNIKNGVCLPFSLENDVSTKQKMMTSLCTCWQLQISTQLAQHVY